MEVLESRRVAAVPGPDKAELASSGTQKDGLQAGEDDPLGAKRFVRSCRNSNFVSLLDIVVAGRYCSAAAAFEEK